jgi:hypothetical protein
VDAVGVVAAGAVGDVAAGVDVSGVELEGVDWTGVLLTGGFSPSGEVVVVTVDAGTCVAIVLSSTATAMTVKATTPSTTANAFPISLRSWPRFQPVALRSVLAGLIV